MSHTHAATAASAGSAAPVHDKPAPIDEVQLGLPPFVSGAARYCYLFTPQDERDSLDLVDVQDVPTPAAAAHPGTPARHAYYEWAAERQAPRKEARRSAYAAVQARPYPPAKDRIMPYVGTPRREQALPVALLPPPPPPQGLLRAQGATRASTV